jgi:uncharacterized protein (TIGR00369 family)
VKPAEFQYNTLGTVHGGIAATLLDSAMGCAVQTLLAAGQSFTTLQLDVRYVRPVTIETGTILGEGIVIHSGRTLATAEGRVTARDTGKLLAHGTTTCLLLDGASPAQPAARKLNNHQR